MAAVLQASGRKEKGNLENSKVQVTGVVRLVGNDPFAELVITGNEYEWHVEREEEFLLKNYQHMTVTVEGEETVKEMRFANGFSAGERRTLKKIKIIDVQSNYSP